MKEYKIVTQRDKFFGGDFDLQRLEEMLNVYASDGWKIAEVVDSSALSFLRNSDELIMILEREKSAAGKL